MKTKVFLLSMLALTAILFVVQASFAADANDRPSTESMKNGNGMASMMNIMQSGNMNGMMENMNSPEAQKMVDSCNTFMNSYGSNGNGDIQKQSIKLQSYSL